jgi:hypothetical protein
LFGDQTPKENENEDSGEIRFWGTKFKYRYGFLGRGTESADGTSEANGEEEDEGAGAGDDGRSCCSNSDEENEDGEEGDEDDDDESIDIFGHR